MVACRRGGAVRRRARVGGRTGMAALAVADSRVDERHRRAAAAEEGRILADGTEDP